MIYFRSCGHVDHTDAPISLRIHRRGRDIVSLCLSMIDGVFKRRHDPSEQYEAVRNDALYDD